jgi:hypothetical protein
MAGKLGKLAPKFNRKTLVLFKYADPDVLPTPPAKTYWEYMVKDYPMMLNDTLGCCVFACGGHMVQNWTMHAGAEIIPPNSVVLDAYEKVGGYVEGDPSTDNGASITDFLAWWQTNGFAGTSLSGWAKIDQTNLTAVKQAIFMFGALDIGFQVPQSALDQFNAGQPFDVVPDDGGIVGGHSVCMLGYGADGFACITWGKIQYMTNAFFAKYCDEGYALLTQSWLDTAGVSPIAGLNLAQLQADLAAVKA